MLFSISQHDGSGTDFLKNAITYGQTEGLGNDLWRVDDVSVVCHHCMGGTQATYDALLGIPVDVVALGKDPY